jgi:hypothetical protein
MLEIAFVMEDRVPVCQGIWWGWQSLLARHGLCRCSVGLVWWGRREMF